MKQEFIQLFSENFEKSIFSKLTISSVIKDSSEYNEFKSIHIKPFQSKSGRLLSWVYRYSRKDITKNHSLEESVLLLEEYLGNLFSQADMYCVGKEYFLKTDGKEKLTVRESRQERPIDEQHNKVKNRLVDESAGFLKLLGVTSHDGHLKKEKKDKFIQINKFLEFFAVTIQSLKTNRISVLDMGSGKGYLTFSIYDYLKNKLDKDAAVVGVEFRQDMVDLCNELSEEANFKGLSFVKGTIENYSFDHTDVLIALHACDTATDEALFKAIKGEAKVIMVSPCCHKQVRKVMNADGVVASLSKFGIMKERTAEMLTDLIRASILEIYGYQTNIFEFVNSEHTPKNLMITAIKKRESSAEKPEAWAEVEQLKKHFGIGFHYLQNMLTH